jgi:ankyrin repeat protein
LLVEVNMARTFVILPRLAALLVVITLCSVPMASAQSPQASARGRQTPAAQLVEAARRGRIDDVRGLLDGGANVNARATLRETALMAASAAGHAEVVRLLLERGGDPDARDAYRGNALLRAAWSGHLEAARALLEGGAKVDARFFSIVNDRTALMVAAQRGHLGIVELLLKKGADVKAKAANGWTALRYATENRQDEVVKVLNSAGAKRD